MQRAESRSTYSILRNARSMPHGIEGVDESGLMLRHVVELDKHCMRCALRKQHCGLRLLTPPYDDLPCGMRVKSHHNASVPARSSTLDVAEPLKPPVIRCGLCCI